MSEKETALVTVEEGRGLVPKDLEGMIKLSKIMCQSGMMPRGFERPEKIFVAVQLGLELGLKPMQAIQNIAVVNGRPTLWGDAALALCKASGLVEWIKEGPYKNGGEAVIGWKCAVKRKDEGEAQECIFLIDDAKAAGLWNKNVWKQYPKRMLQMRARSFALRDAFPDVLNGMYTREEMFGIDKQADNEAMHVIAEASDDAPTESAPVIKEEKSVLAQAVEQEPVIEEAVIEEAVIEEPVVAPYEQVITLAAEKGAVVFEACLASLGMKRFNRKTSEENVLKVLETLKNS